MSWKSSQHQRSFGPSAHIASKLHKRVIGPIIESTNDFANRECHRYNLACVQDRYMSLPFNDPIHSNFCSQRNFCFYQSQSWAGSDYQRWDPYVCHNADAANNPVECQQTDFDPDVVTPDMMSVTNLYSSNLVWVKPLGVNLQS